MKTETHPFPTRSPKLILAPIRGLTDAVYRNVMAAHFDGFDGAVAPFVVTLSGARIPDRTIRDVMPGENRSWPLVPQILGKDPEGFLRLARRLADLGYSEINWNLGCPFARIAKKGRGCGMLPDPEGIDRFLDAVVADLPVPLSIKTRLGRHRAEEFDAVAAVFNRYPLASVIVHSRTGDQQYRGEPDLDAFARAASVLCHPVVYNGDIGAVADFRALAVRFFGVDTWMIGRGALADPFLPADIKAGPVVPPNERPERVRRFVDALDQTYSERMSGPAHRLDRMKAVWSYLAGGFEDGRRLLKQIHKSRQPEAYRDLVARFFDSGPRWRPSGLPVGAPHGSV